MTHGLRIIAGKHKGLHLAAPEGLETRPLPDRIKQSLCDWLGQDFTGWRVADVCAGSGSFSLEAYSRGAAEVHLIDPGPHTTTAVNTNLSRVRRPASVFWHRVPFQQVLPGLHDLTLVFADPPFPWFRDEREVLAELMTLGADALAVGGRLVIRGERGQILPPGPTCLEEEGTKVYGRSWITIFRKIA